MSVAAGVSARNNQQKKKEGVQRAPSPSDEEVEWEGTCWKQRQIRKVYERTDIQLFVAILIFLNFIAEALNAQVKPVKDSEEEEIFKLFEYIFTISFTIELSWNLYGSWFGRFWLSGWNWFDFIIVIISLVALIFPAMPGITVLRLFRAFRVFRLFKRIQSLKRIIEGVLAALPGVFQAFMVLGILMGIWSVIAVEFFREDAPEEFGNFIKSMFTLWQIMTMDSWSSAIGRELIYDKNNPGAALFFVSYIFIAAIIMANVVIAILLDKYLENAKPADQHDYDYDDYDDTPNDNPQMYQDYTAVPNPANHINYQNADIQRMLLLMDAERQTQELEMSSSALECNENKKIVNTILYQDMKNNE